MPTRDYRLKLAQHFRNNGGWLTAGYFNSTTAEENAARDAMLVDGHIVAGHDGIVRLFRLTSDGKAWLDEHEEQ